jgi:hypothetical protein
VVTGSGKGRACYTFGQPNGVLGKNIICWIVSEYLLFV